MFGWYFLPFLYSEIRQIEHTHKVLLTSNKQFYFLAIKLFYSILETVRVYL